MSQPETGPASPDVIGVWAKVPEDDPRRPELEDVVSGVNDVVRSLPASQLTGDDVEAWPPRVVSGATMLAKRFWRRRDTPAGVQQIADDGSVIGVARSDPDVSMLLNLGAYEKPAVG